MPERFVSALDEEGKFSHTPYSYPKLVEVCTQLTRQIVVKQGGRIEKDEDGQEVFIIPVQKPQPTALEQCWEPGPIADSRFTEEEMAKIVQPAAVTVTRINPSRDTHHSHRRLPSGFFSFESEGKESKSSQSPSSSVCQSKLMVKSCKVSKVSTLQRSKIPCPSATLPLYYSSPYKYRYTACPK